MTARGPRWVGLAVVLAGAAAVAAPAQVPDPVDPARPQQPEERGREPVPDLQGTWRSRRVPDELDSRWSDLSRAPFDGFPVFPSRLSGYGSYPLPGTPDPQTGGRRTLPFPLLPPAPAEATGWPEWARLRDREPLPYAVDLALLVRHSDRVWWRAADVDAYVPLYFHDKLRTVGARAEVQVRQAGEFELLLHASSRLVAQGPTDLHLGALTATAVELDVRRFTRLRLEATARDHHIRLPDGSRLELSATPGDGEAGGPLLVLLTRADEPDRYGGRARLYNAGARAVTWTHAFGTVRLAPGERLTMFLRTPASEVGAPLAAHGVQGVPEGDGRSFEGGDDGRVTWCGARFDVGRGQRLQLDPLQGEPFAATPH